MKKESHPSYLFFILSLSVIAIVMMAIETILKPDEITRQVLRIADDAVCVIFLADFSILFFRAKNKFKYLINWGWLDLLSSIPVLNSMRWGRAVRIMRIFRVLRGVKSAKLIMQLIAEKRSQSIALAAGLMIILLIIVSSISVLQFEMDANSPIHTAEDAIWWSIVTIATVGYGDLAPVTVEGRMIAIVLMVAGVGLFGTISGLVAAWFIGSIKGTNKSEIELLKKELHEIKALLKKNQDINKRK